MKQTRYRHFFRRRRKVDPVQLDCYRFYLWSIGEYRPMRHEWRDIWEYINERKEGDVHGYQII
jgi:hypothetical protein